MEGNPRYKFYLDGTLLTTEPSGWDNIRYFVKYDRELKGLTFFIDANLSFKGDGYTILKDKLYSEGFCSSTLLKIQEKCAGPSYKKVYEGLIKGSKIEIDERDCAVSVKPDDNSYFAKIDKARKQKALLYVGTSKNGVDITPATIAKGEFFNPADGVYYPILAGAGQEYSCSVFSVYEAFRFLVAFMTDGEVEFDSAYFGPGGEQEGLIITSGRVLFTVQTGLSETAFKEEWPEISFDELFKEVDKKKNLGFYMDYSGAKPKMFIEKEQDIPNGVDIVTLDAIDQIKTKILTDRLYNILKVGSSETLDVVSLAFPESIDFVGFKDEQYNIIGDCADDKELNLVSDWIISSNVIEDALVTPSSDYEGEIFLIYTTLNEGTGNYVANRDNHFNVPPPYFYNQSLTNATAVQNYFGSIPESIAKYLGPPIDNTFRAEKTVTQPFTGASVVLTFDDDINPPNYDASGNYDAVLSRYVCPSSGVYSFEVGIAAGYLMSCGDIYLEVRDSTFTTVKALIPLNVPPYYPNPVPPNPPPPPPAIRSATVNLTLNDIVVVRWQCSTLGIINIRLTSYFKCTNTETGGGVYSTQDPKDYFGLLHEFEYFIKRSDFDLIRNNPRGSIVFAQANQNLRRAAISEIQFDPDGTSRVRLLTSISQIPDNVSQAEQKG